jgi:DNA modification methylase
VTVRVLTGDCRTLLASLDAGSVQTCVTSPPYFGLRDYGNAAQIGLEGTPDAFVAELVAVFREVRRVLRDDGTLWLNLGDSYISVGSGTQGEGGEMATRRVAQVRDRKAVHGSISRPPSVAGLRPKNLIGIPWRVAFALQADGWYLRSDIIWHKPNPMPESVTDRPTKSHEYLFLLSKSPTYFYDADAIREDSVQPERAGILETSFSTGDATSTLRCDTGRSVLRTLHRNRRTVWTVATQPFSGAHFATFPPALIEPCILAGSRRGDVVLDPFGGAGTTGLVADRLGRDAILCELNPTYAAMARRRIADDSPLFGDVA